MLFSFLNFNSSAKVIKIAVLLSISSTDVAGSLCFVMRFKTNEANCI